MKEMIIEMTHNMNTGRYIRIILMIVALFFGTANKILAVSEFSLTPATDIKVTGSGTVAVKSGAEGIVTNSDGSHTVTIIVTPNVGNFIKKENIKVQKLLDPTDALARRRTPELSDYLNVNGPAVTVSVGTEPTSNEYTFEVPNGFSGAYIEATFRSSSDGGLIIITANTAVSYQQDGIYLLMEDISQDKVSALFTGSQSTTPFTGIFEGEAKADGTFPKITGTMSHALFNQINGGIVKNIVIEDAQISGTGHIGAVANQTFGDTRIYNCGVLSGSLEGTSDNSCVGGIVGRFGSASTGTTADNTTRVINCYSFADVKTTNGTYAYAAGIVGYNNYKSKNGDIQTMVMNCMFYGNITGGKNILPIYGGYEIDNRADQNGLNTFCYYRYESPYSKGKKITNWYGALAVEDKYLVRFEFYRQLLNSNRPLAAWYALNDADEGKRVEKGKYKTNEMAKWVLDKEIAPYPILKKQGTYPSIVNYDTKYTPYKRGVHFG